MEEQGVKQCCAAFYGSDLARYLLGDSFHPGEPDSLSASANCSHLRANLMCSMSHLAAEPAHFILRSPLVAWLLASI